MSRTYLFALFGVLMAYGFSAEAHNPSSCKLGIAGDCSGSKFGQGHDFVDRHLDRLICKDCKFEGQKNHKLDMHAVDLYRTNLKGSYLKYVNMRLAEYGGSNWAYVHLDRIDLSKSHGSYTDFSHAKIHGVNFKDAFLIGADFTCAEFMEDPGAPGAVNVFKNTRLKKADFAGARFSYASLNRSDWAHLEDHFCYTVDGNRELQKSKSCHREAMPDCCLGIKEASACNASRQGCVYQSGSCVSKCLGKMASECGQVAGCSWSKELQTCYYK